MIRRVFRDPVHGLIEFAGQDEGLAAILDCRAMQRLRRIKQMGLAWLVYTGAEHSRFGHALGAFHVAQQIVKNLDFPLSIARHVKVAALLHDIGHGPFSHTWEQALSGPNHEQWGQRIVTEDDELSTILTAIEQDLPAVLVSFWKKSYSPIMARKLISSELDVDRLDYLLRDGHYSGAGYATYDLDWILHALQIAAVHSGTDPSDLVVDYRRGMYAVEQYLFARSYMYAQVYHHKTVRAAEWMFRKLMTRYAELCRTGDQPPGLSAVAKLATSQEITVSQYLALDDYRILSAIDDWAGLGAQGRSSRHGDPLLADLAERLVTRQLFKTVDLGEDPAVIAELAPKVRAIAEHHFGSAGRAYYHLDTTTQQTYAPSDEEELYVVGHPRHGTISLGNLLDDFPVGRPMSRVLLVCAPELVDALRPLVTQVLKS